MTRLVPAHQQAEENIDCVAEAEVNIKGTSVLYYIKTFCREMLSVSIVTCQSKAWFFIKY